LAGSFTDINNLDLSKRCGWIVDQPEITLLPTVLPSVTQVVISGSAVTRDQPWNSTDQASIIPTLALRNAAESEISESLFKPLAICLVILGWCPQAQLVHDARSQCDNFLFDDAALGSVILALETGCGDRAQCGFVTLDQLEILFFSAGQIDLIIAYSS
jgi:hypothetical protein